MLIALDDMKEEKIKGYILRMEPLILNQPKLTQRIGLIGL